MVWSPLKLRPAVILGYYGYPISGRGKDVNGARSGLDWQRMMDRCQQIILGLILGTELNDNAAAAASTAAQTTFLSIIGPARQGQGLFYPSDLGLITALAIKSRFHLALLTTKLARCWLHASRPSGFGAHFLIRGQIRIC